MSVAPNPDQIYERATAEGRRRLSLSTLDQVSTGFIAGVTIIFGLVALGVVDALVAPRFGAGVGSLAGALAFAIGVVFLVVGRSELFTENFFDPVAAAVKQRGRGPWTGLLRLWGVTLALNLVGGGLLVALSTVDGALPEGGGAAHTLSRLAEEIAGKHWAATLVRAVLAGALITLLSYMLNAVDTVAARILVSYMVGFFLALGPLRSCRGVGPAPAVRHLAGRLSGVRRTGRQRGPVHAWQPRGWHPHPHPHPHRTGEERSTPRSLRVLRREPGRAAMRS